MRPTASSRRPWRRAIRLTRWSPRRNPRSTRRSPIAIARSVDVEAARADLVVAQANERQAKVNVEYGRIKAPFHGVITQRNISPGDYLQPGGGNNGRPLFVLEQIDPVRVFVGVPELASYFVHDQDTALDPLSGDPGSHA